MATLCPRCNFNNPPGMRFCGNCGARFEDTVPIKHPASQNKPGTATLIELAAADLNASMIPVSPDQLGVMMGSDLLERFQKAGLEATGQRRNVTILFVDLTGFTYLSEQLNNEDLYVLIQDLIRTLADDVYKYEGMVDKLTGDGLMALFGAPISYENNAERAIRAALNMQEDVRRLSQASRSSPNGVAEALRSTGTIRTSTSTPRSFTASTSGPGPQTLTTTRCSGSNAATVSSTIRSEP